MTKANQSSHYFVHINGFSIAAALAGAETISVDLSAKWFNKLPKQLELNGITEEQRCLVGDKKQNASVKFFDGSRV